MTVWLTLKSRSRWSAAISDRDHPRHVLHIPPFALNGLQDVFCSTKPSCQSGRAAPLLDTPCCWRGFGIEPCAPVQRLAVASPVRAFVPRHPDQPCADWMRANLIAVGLRPGRLRAPGTPSLYAADAGRTRCTRPPMTAACSAMPRGCYPATPCGCGAPRSRERCSPER